MADMDALRTEVWALFDDWVGAESAVLQGHGVNHSDWDDQQAVEDARRQQLEALLGPRPTTQESP